MNVDTVDAATRSRIMSAIRSKETGPERELARAFRRAGISGWRRHRRVEDAELDFSFPAARLGVNVNGCFWHRHDCGRCGIPKSRRAFWRRKLERNAERDREQRRALLDAGWCILVVWECRLVRYGSDAVAEAVGAALGERWRRRKGKGPGRRRTA